MRGRATGGERQTESMREEESLIGTESTTEEERLKETTDEGRWTERQTVTGGERQTEKMIEEESLIGTEEETQIETTEEERRTGTESVLVNTETSSV